MSYTLVENCSNNRPDTNLKDGCCKHHQQPCHKHEVDCSTVVKGYHNEIKNANAMFDKADSLLNNDLIKNVCYSIDILNEILKLYCEGSRIEDAATAVLKASGCADRCGCGCNFNNSCCKSLKSNANEYYLMEERNLMAALELLKEATYRISAAINNNEDGDKLSEQYYKCVHSSNPNAFCNLCPPSSNKCK